MRTGAQRAWEWLIERLIQVAGALAVVFVLLIFVFLVRDALPIFRETTVGELVGGKTWLPTADPPKFGLLPLILGSLYVTLGALVISIPLGVACATFISEVAPRWMRETLKPAVEMLATIPSVIFGFLGLLLVGPWLADRLGLPVGLFAALGSLMLAFMAMPMIVSVSEDAIRSVPRALRENSLALGATRWQTIRRVVLPAARSGIVAAVLLGLGRAIGETMTVLMVTGNAAVIPQGLEGFLRPVRTMTATIAAEMGETAYHTPHYHALFAIGLLLFIITFVTNTIADAVTRRGGRMGR
ncbi:MAG: phosphate ABC transporter permease subunit PstC [Armatimonadota bacterium]|nr:MAG: phosphate ABC transporter permease subunit PstC [Armatimonadota bacterium]